MKSSKIFPTLRDALVASTGDASGMEFVWVSFESMPDAKAFIETLSLISQASFEKKDKFHRDTVEILSQAQKIEYIGSSLPILKGKDGKYHEGDYEVIRHEVKFTCASWWDAHDLHLIFRYVKR